MCCVEHGLAKLFGWCVQNKLSINIEKTTLLVVDPMKFAENYPRPKLNGQVLERVNGYNYLGVSIDENLFLINFKVKNMASCMLRCINWDRCGNILDQTLPV